MSWTSHYKTNYEENDLFPHSSADGLRYANGPAKQKDSTDATSATTISGKS